MKIASLTSKKHNATSGWMKRISLFAMVTGLSVSGCVQVSAPEDPIVIELNISVQQTVDVNLQEDVENLIENNPELFPE